MLQRLQNYSSMLQTDPLGFVIYVVSLAIAVLASLILHECAHGYVAYRCGDPTAKMMGRLTLNPKAHLDVMGTISLLVLGFGWARPVPVNPQNFRHGRRDDFFVSIAGIVTNLLLFLVSLGLSVWVLYLMAGSDFVLRVNYSGGGTELLDMSDSSTRQSIYFLFMNYLLDGAASSELTQFMAIPWLQHVERLLMLMCSINISLAVFNFLPIPPLDGYHLVNDTLLRGRLQLNANTFRIAQLVLIVICLTGALSGILSTCVNAVYGFFLQLFLGMIP